MIAPTHEKGIPMPRRSRTPILGLFVWYTIGDERPSVTREEMKGWLADAGIAPGYLPDTGRGVDAFRSATSGATDEWTSTSAGDGRLVVRETKVTEAYVMRQVFWEWAEEDGTRGERRVADMQFFRPRRTAEGRLHGTETLRTLVDQRLHGPDKARVEAFVRRCKDQYEMYRERLSAHAVRGVVRTYLTAECDAVAMINTSGGWYLVPPGRRAQVEALRGIVRRCGPSCQLRIIPVMDEPDTREMVAESIDADIAGRAESLKRRIAEWVEANPAGVPTTLRWGRWNGEVGVLQDLLVGYMQQYEGVFERAAGVLEEVLAVLVDLNRSVAADRRP